MQGDEGGFVLLERHPQLLTDHFQAVQSQLVFRRVVAHNGPLQGIAEGHTLGFAQNGEADVVRQGDQQGFVQLLGNLGFDMADQVLRQIQVLHRNLFHQLLEPSLHGLFLHAVDALHRGRIKELPPVALESNAPSGNDQLISLFVYGAQNVIVYDLLDPHFHAHPNFA